jgi:hypothetical protein
MLNINGNKVIFSASFMMAKGDNVLLAPPDIAGLTVKIVADKLESEWPAGAPDFIRRHAENQMICEVPFVVGTADFAADFNGDQFVSAQGPVNCRVSGHRAGAYMLVHVDIHQHGF